MRILELLLRPEAEVGSSSQLQALQPSNQVASDAVKNTAIEESLMRLLRTLYQRSRAFFCSCHQAFLGEYSVLYVRHGA